MFDLISFTLLDLLDILVVAFLLYKLYSVSKGSSAMTLLIGVAILYGVWILVRVLHMELTSTLMGQIMGVGILALIIVFQQEIRSFLIYVGNQYMQHRRFSLRRFITRAAQTPQREDIIQIIDACTQMGASKTGALIILGKESNLDSIAATGTHIDAAINTRLIQNIFFKNSPLHDGALIINNNRILAAQCILPVSKSTSIPKRLGLRHRAALGITEQSNALAIVVSEETGMISLAKEGKIREGFNTLELEEALNKIFLPSDTP